MADEKFKFSMNNSGPEEGFKFQYGISNVITSIVYYNSLLRDTLEYCLKKASYSTEAYQYRKNGIVKELEIDSPLHKFLVNNGENGEKLSSRLKDFGNLVYGDDSTILHLSDDGLRVDQAQHITLIENVIILHEEINGIIRVHLDFARKNNQLEPDLTLLTTLDEKFYRSIVLFTILNELEFQFSEYNKARADAKGEKTAASNFIEKDISKLIGLFDFSRKRASVTDKNYTDVLDAESNLIEMTMGKRDLPVGKNFKDVFDAVRQLAVKYVAENEQPWREQFTKCIKSLVLASNEVKNGDGSQGKFNANADKIKGN